MKGEGVRALDALCRPRIIHGRRHARFNPLDRNDLALFRAVLAGHLVVRGFRNTDIVQRLYRKPPGDQDEAHRRCERISRLIAKLRGHGLVAKVPRARRYRVTRYGHQVLAAAIKPPRQRLPGELQRRRVTRDNQPVSQETQIFGRKFLSPELWSGGNAVVDVADGSFRSGGQAASGPRREAFGDGDVERGGDVADAGDEAASKADTPPERSRSYSSISASRSAAWDRSASISSWASLDRTASSSPTSGRLYRDARPRGWLSGWRVRSRSRRRLGNEPALSKLVRSSSPRDQPDRHHHLVSRS